jgi:hypothetical protein
VSHLVHNNTLQLATGVHRIQIGAVKDHVAQNWQRVAITQAADSGEREDATLPVEARNRSEKKKIVMGFIDRRLSGEACARRQIEREVTQIFRQCPRPFGRRDRDCGS